CVLPCSVCLAHTARVSMDICVCLTMFCLSGSYCPCFYGYLRVSYHVLSVWLIRPVFLWISACVLPCSVCLAHTARVSIDICVCLTMFCLSGSYCPC
ncbi:predicted protein, partial [Nematostella vectensis]